MQRFTLYIAAAVLTLLVVGAVLYWGAGSMINPPVVAPDLSYLTRGPHIAAPHPADWKKVETGQGFSFYAPPDARFQAAVGPDSFIGDIQTADFHLQYDFGFYSNTLAEAKNYPGYSEEAVTVDGRPGLIRKATMGKDDYFVGIYIEEAVYHSEYPGRWAALEFHGSTTSPQVRATVETMLKTIAFDPPAAKNGH